VSCAKTAEPMEMPFGLWARMGPRNQVFHGSPEVPRDVAMATNFGTNIAITGFLRTIATGQLVMEGGLSGQPTKCRYCRYLALKRRCQPMANTFWLWMGYKFACVIASGTIFDSRGGFSGSRYVMKL